MEHASPQDEFVVTFFSFWRVNEFLKDHGFPLRVRVVGRSGRLSWRLVPIEEIEYGGAALEVDELARGLRQENAHKDAQGALMTDYSARIKRVFNLAETFFI